ncbi:LAFA_0E19086g1_1 [Lachancea sp. 'fantastica']|nr:LAFA_0E19086g1_1 [Lachancea sp. 'fantastica']
MVQASVYRKRTCTVDAVFPRSSKSSTLDPVRDVLKVVYDVYESQWIDTGYPLVNYVLLHGSGMSRKVWEYYVDKLTLPDNKNGCKIGKIILIDQVNHGDSAVLNANLLGTIYDWSDGARDVCKVCMEEFYNLSRKSDVFNVVIGHSMGGFQALSCGVLFPGLFDFVQCIEPVVWMKRIRNAKDDNISTISPSFYQALTRSMTDEFASENDFNKFFDQSSLYANSTPAIRKLIREFELIEEPDSHYRTKTSAKQHMLTYLTLNPTATWLMSSLPFLTSPVLCIYGNKSKWCPPENRNYLRSHIQHYQEVEVDGGHLINIEAPDPLIARINMEVEGRIVNLTPKVELDDTGRSNKFESDYKSLLKQRILKGTPKL